MNVMQLDCDLNINEHMRKINLKPFVKLLQDSHLIYFCFVEWHTKDRMCSLSSFMKRFASHLIGLGLHT